MTKITQSLLALAVSSSVVLAQGWSGAPGKGLTYDGGEAFSLKMSNQLQTRWQYTSMDVGDDVTDFSVPRARTKLSGHAFDTSVHYVLMVDATDAGANDNLKDGYVVWDFTNDGANSVGLRMGRGKTQYGLEGTGTSKGLFFTDRSLAAQTFSNQRSTGAWVQGSHMENKLRWNVGAMNGAADSTSAGENALNNDDTLSYVASINFDPMGDTTGGKGNEGWMQGDFREGDRSACGTIGLGIAQDSQTAGATDLTTDGVNFNTAWSFNGFQVMGEFFGWESDAAGDPDADGFTVSGTYVLPKNADSAIQWGFGARVSSQDTNSAGGGIGGATNEITDTSLVVNAFYHGHAMKTQFELTNRETDGGGTTTDDMILTLQFQLLF